MRNVPKRIAKMAHYNWVIVNTQATGGKRLLAVWPYKHKVQSQKFKLFINAYGRDGWIGWHVWKLKTNSRWRKCNEPSQMTCVTNPMYHPYSKISSIWIPSVNQEFSNRELQVDLMCFSLLFLIFVWAPLFYHGGSSGTVYERFRFFNGLDFGLVWWL
jgi:hypothetical protein